MPTTKAQSSEFRTSDLYFAAYLRTAAVEMTKTERDPDGKVHFVFDTSIANIEELKQGWFSSTARVPANTYAYNIKSLKSLCHMH